MQTLTDRRQRMLAVLLLAGLASAGTLHTEYEWKYFDYLWDSPAQREQYVRNGWYDYRNLTSIDVDRSADGRTFVTIIRAPGVPASVHTISDKRGAGGPLLKPYPDWTWYRMNNDNCQGIVSAFRVAMDPCNRLWVLDTGVMGEARLCSAKLIVFDLGSDRLLFQKIIPDSVAQSSRGLDSLLITPILETYGAGCEDTTVYMGDVTGHALVIWNERRLFRLEADVFEPEQRHSSIEIAGQSFFLDDGVLGMALSPGGERPDDGRNLTFRPLASLSVYSADTRVLQRSVDGTRIKYYRGRDVLPSQASAMAYSRDGTLFYGLTRQTGIGCWNARNPMTPAHFDVAITDQRRLQFTSGMKVVKSPIIFFPKPEEQLLLMTNRLQKLYTNTYNFDEINFRVLRASVAELKRATKC